MSSNISHRLLKTIYKMLPYKREVNCLLKMSSLTQTFWRLMHGNHKTTCGVCVGLPVTDTTLRRIVFNFKPFRKGFSDTILCWTKDKQRQIFYNTFAILLLPKPYRFGINTESTPHGSLLFLLWIISLPYVWICSESKAFSMQGSMAEWSVHRAHKSEVLGSSSILTTNWICFTVGLSPNSNPEPCF